jgi:hypothetical protein
MNLLSTLLFLHNMEHENMERVNMNNEDIIVKKSTRMNTTFNKLHDVNTQKNIKCNNRRNYSRTKYNSQPRTLRY